MDRQLTLAVVLVLVGAAVSLIVFLALILTMPELPSALIEDQICLPKKDGQLICGSMPDLFRDFLERTVEKANEEKETKTKERGKQERNEHLRQKPATKLIGKKQFGTSNKENVFEYMVPVVNLHYDKALHGFGVTGIRYQSGRLISYVDGAYFTDSYLDLFVPCDTSSGKPNIENPDSPIKHAIYKSSKGRETEVVSYVQPHIRTCSDNVVTYSSYVSTLVELRVGDELLVKPIQGPSKQCDKLSSIINAEEAKPQYDLNPIMLENTQKMHEIHIEKSNLAMNKLKEDQKTPEKGILLERRMCRTVKKKKYTKNINMLKRNTAKEKTNSNSRHFV